MKERVIAQWATRFLTVAFLPVCQNIAWVLIYDEGFGGVRCGDFSTWLAAVHSASLPGSARKMFGMMIRSWRTALSAAAKRSSMSAFAPMRSRFEVSYSLIADSNASVSAASSVIKSAGIP